MKWSVDINPLALEYGMQQRPFPLPAGARERGKPQAFEVDAETKRKLYDDGAVIIPNLLDDEWLHYLRELTNWQVQHPHFWSVAGVASGLYDYIQRSVWSSNEGFADFLYYSPLASALASVSNATELRVATDLLMVNPNKGFKWHQDNQNGPIDAFGNFDDGTFKSLRWWVTMDDTPADYGAPVYLRGSHRNSDVSEDAVFVDLESDNLLQYPELLEFRPKAGDLIVWHSRAIHKIDGPTNQDWGSARRRVLGGTVACNEALYEPMGRALFSDMGSHGLNEGAALKHPLFPRIYPSPIESEMCERAAGRCTRTTEGMQRLAGNMFSSVGEMMSWTRVLNKKQEAEKSR